VDTHPPSNCTSKRMNEPIKLARSLKRTKQLRLFPEALCPIHQPPRPRLIEPPAQCKRRGSDPVKQYGAYVQPALFDLDDANDDGDARRKI
jgi:hypothetical protein